MALSVGDKLGPYEILAPIGKGGMGEVQLPEVFSNSSAVNAATVLIDFRWPLWAAASPIHVAPHRLIVCA